MLNKSLRPVIDANLSRILVVLDVDSTLIDNEVIELIAAEAGSEELVASITERAMRGEIDFAQSLIERVSTLKGLPKSVFNKVQNQVTVTNGVPEFIRSVHRADGVIAVVSGGFHEILDPLAMELGLNYWKANRLQITDNTLTGKLSGPIVDAQAKADALREWGSVEGISPENCVAIGDGANDLLMMEAAGLSVAFNAKPIVSRQADVAIEIRDMRLVLPYIGL